MAAIQKTKYNTALEQAEQIGKAKSSHDLQAMLKIEGITIMQHKLGGYNLF